MTNRDYKLSLARQAALLGISRGSLYDQPHPTDEDDLKLMRRIDELHMEHPFAPFHRSCGSSVGQLAVG